MIYTFYHIHIQTYVTIKCDGETVENVFSFKYLGSLFTADDNHKRDVEQRCAMATSRCGELCVVFGSKIITLATKLKIYKQSCGMIGINLWK